MKKSLTVLSALLLLLLTACVAQQDIALPAHKTMLSAVKGTGTGLYSAYVRAVDSAINIVIDKILKKKPEFISFDWGTNFALSAAEREQMVAAFGSYGVLVDTRGLNPPLRTVEELGKGVTLVFPTGSQHASSEADFTITVEVVTSNQGYAYYYDFDIHNGNYVLVAYSNAYVNPRG